MLKKLYLFWTGSITRQLMLGIALVHAVLMSVFVFDLVERQRNFMVQHSYDEAVGLANTLATNGISWLLANDFIGLEEVINSQAQYPALHYAMFLDMQGKVMGYTDHTKVGQYIEDDTSKRLLWAADAIQPLVNTPRLIDIASPIRVNGKQIGWARVGISRVGIADNLKFVTINGLIYTAIAISIGVFFGWFMARRMTVDIKALVANANKVREGESGVDFELDRPDELGKLSHHFNRMVKRREEQSQKLYESEHLLQSIINNAVAPIFLKDPEGRYLLVNNQFEKLSQLSSDIILGKTSFDLFPKDFATMAYEQDEEVKRRNTPLVFEETVSFNDIMCTFIITKFPVYDGRGNLVSIGAVYTDITKRKTVEKQLYETNKQLLHSEKLSAIGRFSASIAHEINNPLQGVLNVIRGVQERAKLTERDQKLVYLGLKECYRMKDLIISLQQFNKPTSGIRTELNIHQLIDDVLIFAKKEFRSKKITIKKEFTANLPNIRAVPDQIKQVIVNILGNAGDSLGTEGGTITLSTTLPDEKHICIAVKDCGDGISPENIKEIFEPFYSTKAIKGTGLGLSISYGIVKSHGGSIGVESKVGEGATFTITLPIEMRQISA